jgi:hypothetical protein
MEPPYAMKGLIEESGKSFFQRALIFMSTEYKPKRSSFVKPYELVYSTVHRLCVISPGPTTGLRTVTYNCYAVYTNFAFQY